MIVTHWFICVAGYVKELALFRRRTETCWSRRLFLSVRYSWGNLQFCGLDARRMEIALLRSIRHFYRFVYSTAKESSSFIHAACHYQTSFIHFNVSAHFPSASISTPTSPLRVHRDREAAMFSSRAASSASRVVIANFSTWNF